MARPSGHSVETRLRIVLGVLRGEMTAAEAARRHGVSETSTGKWKDQFLVAGRQGLAASGQRRAPNGREARLAGEVDELTRALGEAHVELRLLRRDLDGGGLPPTPSWR